MGPATMDNDGGPSTFIPNASVPVFAYFFTSLAYTKMSNFDPSDSEIIQGFAQTHTTIWDVNDNLHAFSMISHTEHWVKETPNSLDWLEYLISTLSPEHQRQDGLVPLSP